MEKYRANVLFGEGMSEKKLAVLKRIRRHRNNLRLLRSCLNSFPPEVRRLFFNIRSVAYFPKDRRYCDAAAVFPSVSRSSIRVYPLAFRYPKKTRLKVRDYLITVLMHEVAHSLDFTDHGLGYIPDKVHEGITEVKWYEALAAEPESPEDFPGCGRAFRRYTHKPSEQWAIRMALTITCDYLVPVGLIGKNNIVRVPKTLSAAEFKEKWPKSYEFFRRYIKKILTHGQ